VEFITRQPNQATSPLLALSKRLSGTLIETRPNAFVGTLGVFLGAGLATMYGRLLSVGLADLRGALNLGVDEASWIPTVYNMTVMFMGPFSVYLGALLGTRRVLLWSAPVFIVASLLLPFSPNLGVMFALQVIAGLSSGTFYPLTLSYALRSLPLRYSIFGIGVYSIDILSVTSLAVPLEGWFLNHLSWHWIFWFSAALTPLMMLCIYRAIPQPPKRTGPKPLISWAGFLYASIGLSLIFAALDQGQRLNWLESGVFVALLTTGIFFLMAAIIRRWLSPNPLVNLSFINKRNTLILAGGLLSFRFVLLAIAVLIPAFLGTIKGYRPSETGEVLLWIAIPQVLTGITAAWLMRRFDGRLIIAVGFALVATACLLNAQLTSAWSGNNFWISQLVMAAGLSLTFVSLVGLFIQQGAVTGAFSRPVDVLTYSAFIHIVRLFGGEIGTAFMQRLIAVREQFHSNLIGLHVDAASWLSGERLRLLTGGVLTNSAGQDEAQQRAVVLLGSQVRQQAFTLSYADGFMVIVWVCIAIIALLVFMEPMKILFDSSSMEPPK
jgi:DHA2 family multidrug resistance protein